MKCKHTLSLLIAEFPATLSTLMALELFKIEGISEINSLYYFFLDKGVIFMFYLIRLLVIIVVGLIIDLTLNKQKKELFDGYNLLITSFSLSLYMFILILLSMNSIHDTLVILWLLTKFHGLNIGIDLFEKWLTIDNKVFLIIFAIMIVIYSSLKIFANLHLKFQ